ncbi:zinc finger protein Xfin-like isoform X2 [Anopheles bellator]|uniref:zinc finger protein Xfin-like isoform X2 n=1 Tax=Anopheles bellator TaxID=139047 RepID=UPI002649B3A2|nr:zinc finger protein Xfin-like isoform X2 [Anopheles bellator]
MNYNAYENKLYAVSQPIQANLGYFSPPNTTSATLPKEANPLIKQEQPLITAGSFEGSITPPVNYSQSQHYTEGNGTTNTAKPLYYRKHLDLQLMSNAYVHHHPQQQFISSHLQQHEHQQLQQHVHPHPQVLQLGELRVHNLQQSPAPQLTANHFTPASPAQPIPMPQSTQISPSIGSQNPGYNCGTCSKSFSTKLRLSKHLKTHISDYPDAVFKCRMCEKKFRTKSTLICHEKVHGENGIDNRFSCAECGKIFGTGEKLQVHRRLHTGEKPYQCKVKKALKCERCSKVLDNEERLVIHMRLHTGEKPYKCSYCDKRFNHKSTVSTHEKAAHIAANSFQCNRCHKTFNQKCQLQYHEKLQEEHMIGCAMCEKVFCYKASHKEHMFKVHFPRQKKEQKTMSEPVINGGKGSAPGRNKYKCTVCDRRFYYARALDVHMGVHDSSLDVNVLYFSCNYCPETFIDDDLLRKHESEHIANCTAIFLPNIGRGVDEEDESGMNGRCEERDFFCPLCFKQFDDQKTLSDHHKTHLCSNADCTKCGPALRNELNFAIRTYDGVEDKRETVCNVCQRVLPTFEQFQNHFHYHTSRVPFYCYHCRVEFNDKRELYTHAKAHLPRVSQSYTCKICSKVFSTKGNFKRHLKSHETVRAFACDRCFKQYDYKSALEAHLKRSHGIAL